MEIIFLILVALDGNNLAHLEMQAYHLLPHDIHRERPCAEFLKSDDLRRYATQRLPPGQTVRAACQGAMSVPGLAELVAQSEGWRTVKTGPSPKVPAKR